MKLVKCLFSLLWFLEVVLHYMLHSGGEEGADEVLL